MMPVMNGWQFRAEQLKDPRLASVPVLVISADPQVQTKAASLGAAGLLRKPISLDDLLLAVKTHTLP
jgi:CheY-like chemotaxis protein